MSIPIDQILDITGERVPYSNAAMDMARGYAPEIPPDVFTFMEHFGEGSFNCRLGINSPETWESKVHEPYFETGSNIILPPGQLPPGPVEGVYFAGNDLGDALIATGADRHGIVLKNRGYGGFWPVGKTFAEALRGIFMSPSLKFLHGTRVYFTSLADRWPSVTLQSDATVAQIEARLATLSAAIMFEEEGTRCCFYPAHRLLVSLVNASSWGKGFSEALVTTGQVGITDFMWELSAALDDLGFMIRGSSGSPPVRLPSRPAAPSP